MPVRSRVFTGSNLSPRCIWVRRVRSRIDAVEPFLSSTSFTGLNRVLQGFPALVRHASRAGGVRTRLGQVDPRAVACRWGHLAPECSPSDPNREWCSWCRHDMGLWEPGVREWWGWCLESIRGRR